MQKATSDTTTLQRKLYLLKELNDVNRVLRRCDTFTRILLTPRKMVLRETLDTFEV